MLHIAEDILENIFTERKETVLPKTLHFWLIWSWNIIPEGLGITQELVFFANETWALMDHLV